MIDIQNAGCVARGVFPSKRLHRARIDVVGDKSSDIGALAIKDVTRRKVKDNMIIPDPAESANRTVASLFGEIVAPGKDFWFSWFG